MRKNSNTILTYAGLGILLFGCGNSSSKTSPDALPPLQADASRDGSEATDSRPASPDGLLASSDVAAGDSAGLKDATVANDDSGAVPGQDAGPDSLRPAEDALAPDALAPDDLAPDDLAPDGPAADALSPGLDTASGTLPDADVPSYPDTAIEPDVPQQRGDDAAPDLTPDLPSPDVAADLGSDAHDSGSQVIGGNGGWGRICSTCVFYVDRSVGSPGNGSSPAGALSTVQAGINAAAAAAGADCTCDVRVAAATYYIYSTGTNDTVQLKARTRIYGGYPAGFIGARDITANPTILDGHASAVGGAPQVRHVVTGADNTTIDGFTVRGGLAQLNDSDTEPANYGAGMINLGVSPIVSNCTFTQNSARWGGAVYNRESSPSFTGCSFINNSASFIGGAAANRQATVTYSSCAFASNSGDQGGAMYVTQTSTVTLNQVSFSSNSADRFGGAMIVDGGSNLRVLGSVFRHNTAGGDGGAIYTSGLATVTLSNTLLNQNTAIVLGGALYNNTSTTMTIVDSTLYGNTATANGDAIFSNNSSPTVTNSIVWTSVADPAHPCIAGSNASQPVVTYSDVQGGCTIAQGCTTDQTGNLNTNPVFASVAGEDFRLWVTSPLIDQGSNAAVPAALTTDRLGQPRVVDGNGDATATVDMGAYELSAAATSTIYVDPAAVGDGTGASWQNAYTTIPWTAIYPAMWIRGSAGADVFDFDAHNFAMSKDVHLDGLAGSDTLKIGEMKTGDALDNVSNVENISFSGTNALTITTVDGLVTAGGRLTVDSSAATDSFTWDGSAEQDGTFTFIPGTGTQTLTGGHGDDIFDFRNAALTFTSSQHVDGAQGNDTLKINSVSGGDALDNVSNVENISFHGASALSITTADGLVAAGGSLTVDSSAATNSFTWNGAAESDGTFTFIPGTGTQTLTGGHGDDIFDFRDAALTFTSSQHVDGAQGNDTLKLRAYSGNTALNGVANVETIILTDTGAVNLVPAATVSRNGQMVTIDGTAVTADFNFDGHANPGAFTISAPSVVDGTLSGGSGSDTITVVASGNYTVNGFGGNDTISLSGTGNLRVNGGPGSDAIDLGVHSNSAIIQLADLTSGEDTISHFVGPEGPHDTLDISTGGGLSFVDGNGSQVTAPAAGAAIAWSLGGAFDYNGGFNTIFLTDMSYVNTSAVVAALENGGADAMKFVHGLDTSHVVLVVYSDGTNAHVTAIGANPAVVANTRAAPGTMTFTDLATITGVTVAQLQAWGGVYFFFY